MDAATRNLQYWIKEMLIKKGIDKYTMDWSGSSSKGDGYVGEINFVKVVCDLGKDGTKVYEIVVKSAKANKDDRKNLPVEETYKREMKMYLEIFPIIDQFQRENAIENQFSNYPECYSVCTTEKQEALLLSNLKSLGYVIHDRLVPQNLDHITFVFKTYALWHGSSIALKLKKPELFKKVTAEWSIVNRNNSPPPWERDFIRKPVMEIDMTDIMKTFLNKSKMVPTFKKCFEKAIDILRNRGNTTAADKFEKAASDILTIITEVSINDDEEELRENVILHGDCWNNNMMFKYKENDSSKPIDMKFLDFQLSRPASPVRDLSYYLYSVTDKPALDKFDDLLEEYHKTLTIYLQQFAINCDDILTLKRLKELWKKYGKFGLVLCPFVMRIELSQGDEVIDFSEEVGNKTMDGIDIDNMKLQNEYDRRVFNVFSHFAEKFL